MKRVKRRVYIYCVKKKVIKQSTHTHIVISSYSRAQKLFKSSFFGEALKISDKIRKMCLLAVVKTSLA